MNKQPFYIFIALVFFFAVPSPFALFGSESAAFAQSKPTTFGHIRALSLPQVRALALERAPAIAAAKAKIEAAKAEERQLKKRIVPNFGGGIDPFSGQVRYYMNLDFQRLFQLNKAERQKAHRAVEAEQLGQTDAQNGAIASVTSAWFGLQRAEAAHTTARRNLITAKAIFVSADARFRGGTGELGSVLSALNGKASSEDAVTSTRQSLLLACLTLAQASGYPTAEEMEAALASANRRESAATSSDERQGATQERFGVLLEEETTPEGEAIEEQKDDDAQERLAMTSNDASPDDDTQPPAQIEDAAPF